MKYMAASEAILHTYVALSIYTNNKYENVKRKKEKKSCKFMADLRRTIVCIDKNTQSDKVD